MYFSHRCPDTRIKMSWLVHLSQKHSMIGGCYSNKRPSSDYIARRPTDITSLEVRSQIVISFCTKCASKAFFFEYHLPKWTTATCFVLSPFHADNM